MGSDQKTGNLLFLRPVKTVGDYFQTEHLLADLKSRSLKGVGVTLISQSALFAIRMGSTMVLARLLLPADFGLIAMVSVFVGFVSLFKDLGLSMATVQRSEITHAQVSTLFWINLGLSCVLMVVVGASAPLLAWFYNEQRLFWVTIILAGTFIFSGLTVQHQALLNRQMRFKSLAIIDVVSQAAGVAVAIAMASLAYGYWALVWMIVASSLANCLLVWMLTGWHPGRPSALRGVRTMLAFGGGLSAFNVINYFTRNADNVIIGYLLGSAPLGIYSKAYNLLLMPIQQINTPVGSVMLPTLSRLQDDPDRYRRYFLGSLGAIGLITMPLVTFLFIMAEPAVLVLLGDQWTQAISVFRWLAPAAFFGSINVAPGWLCTSLGRAKIQVRWAVLSAPISIAAFLVGVRWGVEGVAASFSATWCVLFVLFLYWSCRNSPVHLIDLARTLAAPVAWSVVAAALSALIFEIWEPEFPPLMHLVSGLIIFAAIYTGICFSTPSSRQLIKTLPSMLRGGGESPNG